LLRGQSATPQDLRSVGINVSSDGQRRSLWHVLSLPDASEDRITALVPDFMGFPEAIRRQTAADALYAPYLDRQSAEVAALRRDEMVEIPVDLAYGEMSGLSAELRGKLQRRRPANLAEAARVEGVTPAALTLILAHVRRAARKPLAV
jgi:tRNA uridine 5-carboxymethylaminomethyl modification enzyme